jgi:hypothetical protein
MPNQMIALQARNPQLPDPSRQTAQFANMMNMARQQEAAQLQGERLRQEMEYARAGEARAVETQAATMREKDLDIEDKEMVRLYKIGAALLETEDPTTREAGYQNLLGLIEKTSPQLGATMRQVAGTFNPQVLQSVMMETEQYFNKKYATPVASLELSQGGLPRSVVVGGLNPEQRPVYDAPEAMAPAAAPRATPTAPQTNPMAAGATPRSADAEPGSLGLVVASALETGVMSKTDYDKMLSIAPPQSRAKIAAWAQQNNIEIVPDAPGVTDNRMRGAAADFETSPMSYDGQTPQSQFAVFRGQPMQAQTAGLGGAPEMRQTLAQARTSTPLQMRDPRVSPLPGSAQVPLGRVAGEAAAQEGGKQGVRVKVEPAIAGATKTAELRAQKDAAFPDAQSQFEAAYTTVKNRLSDIKRFKEHPAATRVIGPIDAFTLNTGRARGAQEIYRTMVAAATFDALQEMRTNSPTGGALGNVSDADIRILKESIGALGQAQDEKDFFESLDIYEDRLNQVLGRLEKRFRGNYGYRLGSGWKPAEVATKRRTPTTGGRKAGAFTITEVDE